MDWEAYLTGKGHRGRRATGAEVAYPCFFDCEEPADSRKRKLYVNVESGLYSCKVCVSEGNGVTLMRHFGDEPETTDQPSIGRRAEVLEAATAAGERMLAANDDALMYLLGPRRRLSPEVINDRRLGYAPRQWPLTRQLPEDKGFKRQDLIAAGILAHSDRGDYEYYQDRILIPYLENGRVVQLRGKDIFGRYYTPIGDAVYLYNVDALKGATEAVLVEGEFDAMMLAELLATSTDPRFATMAVIGLAGTGALPEDFTSRMAHLKRVFIATDPDEPGRRAAANLLEKLDGKGYVVDWPQALLDRAHTDGYTDKDIDWTLWIGKYHATLPEVTELLHVKGRLSSAMEALTRYRQRPTTGIKMGFTGLDSAILPGLLPGQVVCFLAKTGVGKGHPLATATPTPSGLRHWGDLAVGDQVFGSDGTPTTVTNIYDRGVLPTYRVAFSDGTSVECDGEHIWEVAYRSGHGREWTWTNKTVHELLDAGLRHGKEYRFKIPMTGPVQYDKRELPVEPYTLGSLIANGYLCGTSAVLTTPDRAVVDRVAVSHAVTEILCETSTCPRFVIRGVIGAIREMGLCVRSGDKFIPEDYLTTCVEDRIALLQGLMDGDGGNRTDRGRSAVLYYTSSPRLAEGVVRLVTSLGGTAKVWWNAKRHEARVSIMLSDGMDPFGTVRKSARPQMTYHTEARRAIVDITRVEDQHIRCITVAAADQLYLIGEQHVVTHNTVILCNLAYNLRKRRVLFVTLEMTAEEIWVRLARIFRFYEPFASDETIAAAYAHLRICDSNRLSETDFANLMDEYVDAVGDKPELVFVDYLGYYARGRKGGSQYEKVTDAVMQLKAEAKAHQVVIITPSQVNRMAKDGKPLEADDARDSGAIEESVDFLFGAWRSDDALDANAGIPNGKLHFKILKSRHGNRDRVFLMQMGLMSLVVVDDTGIHADKAHRETHAVFIGKTYEQWLSDVRNHQPVLTR